MIQQNITFLKKRISEIAAQCGRKSRDIKLVAVSKRFPVEAIREAQKAGQTLFGENYLQEAQDKKGQLDEKTQLHFIGHLQSNKAKIATKLFTMIETVDRIKLARILNKHLVERDKSLDILIQVNIGRDTRKSGVLPEDAEKLIAEAAELPQLRIQGLMTMPPFTKNPENARPYFRNLRKLAEGLQSRNLFFDCNAIELSMGMTHDYQIAIEEGATLIRIGTAIFGERPPLQ